jgi:hypothetical protein
MIYKISRSKDDEIFNLQPKKNYGLDPSTNYLKPVDAPASKLRAYEFVGHDTSKPAVNYRVPIVLDNKVKLTEEYLQYINNKINYIYK